MENIKYSSINELPKEKGICTSTIYFDFNK